MWSTLLVLSRSFLRRSVAILVLPGGTDRSYQPFSRRQGPSLRMFAFTWAFRLRFGPAAVVRQASYRVYGWNGQQDSPVMLARRQLDDLCAAAPGVPVVVVGHSMGGRVAAHLAAAPRVTGVLALAPWWQYADWEFIHPGATVLAIHGSADTRTYPERTAKGINRLRAKGVAAQFISVPNGGHAMLDHLSVWHGEALRFVSQMMR